MKPVRRTSRCSIPFLLVLALVPAFLLPTPGALGQTLESRVETLEAHEEILRSRQGVLTGDVNEFKEDVAEATAAIRAEMDTEVSALSADMATEDSAIRTEMATENTAIRAEIAAVHSLPAADGDPTEAVYVDNAGKVGIGTTNPAEKLEVHGSVMLGSTGALFAPGGEENLRIVRGNVNADGTIAQGEGFTAAQSLPHTGRYSVSFNTPFSDTPSVTVTAGLSGYDEDEVVNIVNVTNEAFYILICDVGEGYSAPRWCWFSFIAVGPR